MIAPRFGFSWDVKGDNRSKIFGNAGRYFLPVANVINIKQAGGFLDERTYYVFGGFAPFEYNGELLKVRLEIAFFSYPEKNMLGNFTRTASISGMTEKDPGSEDDLVKTTGESAITQFAKVAPGIR